MRFGSRHLFFRPGLLAITIATATLTLAQTNPVVEVSVVDADSGQPIPHAKVILYDGAQAVPDREVTAFADREASGLSRRVDAPPPRGSRSVETNDSGKVVLAELKPGSYRLDAEADGYVPQRRQYLPGVIAGGISVNVASGDKTNVQMRLKRAGTVAGTVKNFNNEPVADFSVYVLQPTFFRTGERRLFASMGTTTDKMGHFTLAGLPQGRYYVAAGSTVRSIASAGDSDPTELYQFSYYPGVPDPASASRRTPFHLAITASMFGTVSTSPPFSIRT